MFETLKGHATKLYLDVFAQSVWHCLTLAECLENPPFIVSFKWMCLSLCVCSGSSAKEWWWHKLQTGAQSQPWWGKSHFTLLFTKNTHLKSVKHWSAYLSPVGSPEGLLSPCQHPGLLLTQHPSSPWQQAFPHAAGQDGPETRQWGPQESWLCKCLSTCVTRVS